MDFDFRHIIFHDRAFRDCFVVRQQGQRRSLEAVDLKLGIEKPEDGIRLSIFDHQVGNPHDLREFNLHSYAWDQVLRYVEDVAVFPVVQFERFPLLDPIPSRDESLVVNINSFKFAGKRGTVILVPESIYQMRSGEVPPVRQYGLEKIDNTRDQLLALRAHRPGQCYTD